MDEFEPGRALSDLGVTDVNDLIHFQLSTRTLAKLFDGKIRFTDALIPNEQHGDDPMVLLECTLFKWSVLSWVGRLFRGAQVRNGRPS